MLFIEWLISLILALAALIPQETPTVVVPTPVPVPSATPAVATVGPVSSVEAVVCAPQYAWDCGTALAIVWCESRNIATATGALGERGWFQLRPEFHQWRAEGGDLYDPYVNTAAAYSLWLERGWQPWSCARGAY